MRRFTAMSLLSLVVVTGCGGSGAKDAPRTAASAERPAAVAPRDRPRRVRSLQPAARRRVVLGAATYLTAGKGWGTAHPRLLNAGGDPALVISRIRWRGWGRPTTRGLGRTAVVRLGAGYYAKLVRVELVAHDLGRCRPAGPLAYLGLKVRMPPRPGARTGPWFEWGGRRGLCAHP